MHFDTEKRHLEEEALKRENGLGILGLKKYERKGGRANAGFRNRFKLVVGAVGKIVWRK